MKTFFKKLISKKATHKPQVKVNRSLRDYWRDNVQTLPRKLSAGSIEIFQSIKARMRLGKQPKNHHKS